MEALILLVILVLLAGPVLAIIALVRTGSIDYLRRTIANLQQQVDDLEQRLRVAQRPPLETPSPRRGYPDVVTTTPAPPPPSPPPTPVVTAPPPVSAARPAPPPPPPPAP